MNSSITLQTPAKINPVLEVLGKRPDGYHELVLVFQAIGLFDELSISKTSPGVRLEILEEPSLLAADDSNLVVKAAKLFFKEILKADPCVSITLRKRIPLAAGLGGGSSDAAATLEGLDRLFETRAGRKGLEPLAAQLGSDVPFFLTGGTALGTGRGEQVTAWETAPEMPLVLVKPQQGLSTPAVYQSGRAMLSSGEKTGNFKNILREKNLPKIAGSLFNSLQPAAFHLMPETEDIKRRLVQAGALGALVSGSGPTVFAIAESRAAAREIAKKMEGEGRTVIVTQTIGTGIQILNQT